MSLTGIVRKTLAPILILLAGAGGFAALKANKPGTEPVQTEEKAWIVDVETIEMDVVSPTLTLYGRVESPRTTQMSAAITADVREVKAREGRLVDAGQALVTLDDRESLLVLEEREAEVEDMRAQIQNEEERHRNDLDALKHEEKLLELSRKAVGRAKDLVGRNVGSQSQLDQSRQEEARQALARDTRRHTISAHASRIAQLQARLRRAEALRGRAQLDVSRTVITAPFAGRISELLVSPGDRVRSGDKLLSMYDTSAVEVRAQVPTRYLPVVRSSLENNVLLTAEMEVDEQVLTATLDRLTAQVTRGSGGVDSLFQINEQNSWLQLGRTVELILTLPAQANVIALPLEALYGTNRVFKLDGERMLGLTVERLGEVRSPAYDGTRVLVRSSELTTGDKVVVTQLPNAIDGLRVRIVDH